MMSTCLVGRPVVFLILTVYSIQSGVKGECGADNAVAFIEDAEKLSETSQADITETNARPMGFEYGVVQYSPRKNLCVKVSGLAGRSVEIMFETDPTAKLCVRNQINSAGQCYEPRYEWCGSAPEDTMYYEFFCDVARGCSQSDVTFWYRITKGPEPKNDTEGMFCQWRDSKYPSEFADISPDMKIPENPDDKEESNSAMLISAGNALVHLTVLLVMWIFH